NEAKYRTEVGPGDASLLCVNPLSFDLDRPAADKTINSAMLDARSELTSGGVSARCENGVLLTSRPDEQSGLDPMPGGGNMHYHDIALFYANIRENSVLRLNAFMKAQR